MSNFLDSLIFEGKTASDIFKEIYHNSKKKDKQITKLIAELSPLIGDASNATVIVPLIKEYLEVGIKNDEHLIKMMAVVQRASNSNSGEESLLTEDEMKQLQLIAENIASDEPKTHSIAEPVKRIG